MSDLPTNSRRKQLRLRHYDYTQTGSNFVTICTHDRRCILGNVVDGKMLLSDAGKVVSECWNDLPNHYQHIELGEFIVMPNHVHGIVVITGSAEGLTSKKPQAGFKPAPTARHSLSEVIRGFKTFSGRRINRLTNSTGQPVWQRNFYEHVIRDETSLHTIREYIVNNPAKWSEDRYNPRNLP